MACPYVALDLGASCAQRHLVCMTLRWDAHRAEGLRFQTPAMAAAHEAFAPYLAAQLQAHLRGCIDAEAGSRRHELRVIVAMEDVFKAESRVLAATKDIIQEKFQLANGKKGRNIMGSIRTSDASFVECDAPQVFGDFEDTASDVSDLSWAVSDATVEGPPHIRNMFFGFEPCLVERIEGLRRSISCPAVLHLADKFHRRRLDTL